MEESALYLTIVYFSSSHDDPFYPSHPCLLRESLLKQEAAGEAQREPVCRSFSCRAKPHHLVVNAASFNWSRRRRLRGTAVPPACIRTESTVAVKGEQTCARVGDFGLDGPEVTIGGQ